MGKKKASPIEIIDIIEKVLIPDEMKLIDNCDKELKKLEEEGKTSGMFYGYHFGLKAGHENTIKILQKTIRAMKGNY